MTSSLGQYLFDVLGDDVTGPDFRGDAYREWEQNVATPALRRKGFEVIRWYSDDEDSYGPLCRVAVCVKDGARATFFYG